MSQRSTCKVCHAELPLSSGRGRPRKHCDSCRSLYVRRPRKTDLVWSPCEVCDEVFADKKTRPTVNKRRVCRRCNATHSYCYSCEMAKPQADFSRNSRHRTELNYYCRQCMAGKRVLHRQKYPGRLRDGELRKRYGITLVEYERLSVSQGGVCAICKQAAEGYELHLDHCHATGRVRGLLCACCNTALGKFRDDVTILRAAADYIEQHM